ncbi:protein Spindly [Anthonomus grandis grandis]|uniref:protein Spindly n=1 Tax=Anthonomus grandis grandis TaxID=2921223 RepID=UPI002166AF46|nr:protein Spindly [Anthonomus grandis grandis]
MESADHVLDFNAILLENKHLKKELEETKQNLYECNRQAKLNDALVCEYRSEIQVLQSNESEISKKLNEKIGHLEDTITKLRSSHFETITSLQSELSDKDQEINSLKEELEILRRLTEVEKKTEVSTDFKEFELLNEIELLNQKCADLEETLQSAQEHQESLEDILQGYKEQVEELKEDNEVRKTELEEKAALVEKLTEDLILANRDLELYRNNPLQDGSKGNSLFAEVDDRRVHLQQKVNNMKSSYVYLKQEYYKHEHLISRLRKENNELRELRKKDLEELQSDQNLLENSAQNRIRVLEEQNERFKKQLEEGSPLMRGDDLCAEYQYYMDVIESQNQQIKDLESKLADQTLTSQLLARSIARGNRDQRILKLRIDELEQEMIEMQEDQALSVQAEILEKPEEVDKVMEAKPFLKSCLKQIENRRRDTEFCESNERSKKKTSMYLEKPDEDLKKQCEKLKTDDDSKSVQEQENAPTEKRGIKFSGDTVSPQGNPVRRRGTKVFILK